MPILEEIPESSTQWSDAPSNMAIIDRSSNVNIVGSHLNNVLGSQHNNIYHGNVTVHQTNSKPEERELTIWDEFTRVRTGQVYIKKTWCTAGVERDPDRDQWKKRGRRNIDAKCTINTARIGNSKYLHIGYSGVDASEAYERDFERFSRTRHANSVQLFGYTSRVGIPALIFYDELIPLSFVWEKIGLSSPMFIYVSYLARQISDNGSRLREMWIDPSTGWLRKGPYVESSVDTSYITFPTTSTSKAIGNQRSLTLQEYGNTEVVQKYLFEFLSINDIFGGLRQSNKHNFELANDEDTISVLSSLPGTIYNRTSLEPVARWSGYRERCHYVPLSQYPKIAQESMVMEDGSVRLTFALGDMRDFPRLWLLYELKPTKEWIDFAQTWLSLAHHIFHQLGIAQGERGDYSILRVFALDCKCEQREQGPIDVPINTTVYLFIHPIPRPSDDESTWNAWMKGRKYFWSFDPFGKEEILDTENEQRNLGLPSFKISTYYLNQSWNIEHYDIIQALHTWQGVDPTSTDLARSVDYPYQKLGIINPDSGRFEEISEDLSTTGATYSITESWSTDSDNSIQASNILQDQDSMDVDRPLVPSTFEDPDSMNVDVQLPDVMEIDQYGG